MAKRLRIEKDEDGCYNISPYELKLLERYDYLLDLHDPRSSISNISLVGLNETSRALQKAVGSELSETDKKLAEKKSNDIIHVIYLWKLLGLPE